MKKINPFDKLRINGEQSRTINIFLIYYLPPILWMTAIFYFSSVPSFSITEYSISDFIIFKGLHMIEYGILYFLIFRAFIPSKIDHNNKLKSAALLSIIYAVSDEIHQTLVPTREGKIRDIIIDGMGILIVYLFIKKNLQLVKKYL